VPVRAGLISRVSGIGLEYFQDHLLDPLEHVVEVVFDRLSRDYAYRSRHAVIADIVFQQVLGDPERRSDQIIRLVRYMNVDFQSDRITFENLVRGRDIAKLFADRVLADRIFEAAAQATASTVHVAHQRAVFELYHPDGSTRRALEVLREAEAEAGSERTSLLHTRAMALRKLALESNTQSEREKLQSESETILRRLIHQGRSQHAYHTLGQLMLDQVGELAEGLRSSDQAPRESSQRQLGRLVGEMERVLRDGLQHNPGETYLLDLRARLSELLDKQPRALHALESALKANPGHGYISRRLAEHHLTRRSFAKAKEILSRCLE
jgi:hypothetical protein